MSSRRRRHRRAPNCGLDDVAADVKDLKSSLTIDLKATDAPTPPRPVDKPAVAAAATTAAVVDVLPAAAAPPEAETPTTETPEAIEAAAPDDAVTDGDALEPDTATTSVPPQTETTPEPEDAPATPIEQSDL